MVIEKKLNPGGRFGAKWTKQAEFAVLFSLQYNPQNFDFLIAMGAKPSY